MIHASESNERYDTRVRKQWKIWYTYLKAMEEIIHVSESNGRYDRRVWKQWKIWHTCLKAKDDMTSVWKQWEIWHVCLKAMEIWHMSESNGRYDRRVWKQWKMWSVFRHLTPTRFSSLYWCPSFCKRFWSFELSIWSILCLPNKQSKFSHG